MKPGWGRGQARSRAPHEWGRIGADRRAPEAVEGRDRAGALSPPLKVGGGVAGRGRSQGAGSRRRPGSAGCGARGANGPWRPRVETTAGRRAGGAGTRLQRPRGQGEHVAAAGGAGLPGRAGPRGPLAATWRRRARRARRCVLPRAGQGAGWSPERSGGGRRGRGSGALGRLRPAAFRSAGAGRGEARGREVGAHTLEVSVAGGPGRVGGARSGRVRAAGAGLRGWVGGAARDNAVRWSSAGRPGGGGRSHAFPPLPASKSPKARLSTWPAPGAVARAAEELALLRGGRVLPGWNVRHNGCKLNVGTFAA